VVLSAHDFALFCRRVNLLERPGGEFCGYCRDLERCGRCLAIDGPGGAAAQGAWRAAGARLARAAAAIVHPSSFMRERHLRLFPDLEPARQLVISPARPRSRRSLAARRPVWPPAVVAFAGEARHHKGIEVFVQVVERLAARGATPPRWRCFGAGDGAALSTLARRGVAVTGYYRAGTLAQRLVESSVDLVLLPSLFPESYSLVLDEVAESGAAVIAHDIGALGQRVRQLGLGWAVAGSPLAEAMAERLLEILDGTLAAPAGPPSAPPTNAEIAAAHLAAYSAVGGAPG
jgi:glycosyltransferase involved in cell wall biosynthesis